MCFKSADNSASNTRRNCGKDGKEAGQQLPKIKSRKDGLDSAPKICRPKECPRRRGWNGTANSPVKPDVQQQVVLDGPQLDPIRLLHRHNGYVSFSVTDGEDLWPKCAIRADALGRLFPGIKHELVRDSLVSLNAAYRHNRGVNGSKGHPQHRNDTLRFLCACYCDLDFYNKGLSLKSVIPEIKTLIKQRKLPRPSILVDGGHGLWLLWLLHDPNDSSRAHVGAWMDNRNDHYQLYVRVNKAIGQQLAYLGADIGATDGARHIRVPGSWRNDQEATVRWKVLKYKNSAPPSYTLKELGNLLGVKPERVRRSSRNGQSEARAKFPQRRKGWKVGRQNTLAAFETLLGLRQGGFDEGLRNRAALIYAELLKLNGASRQDVLTAIDRMGRKCRPALSAWRQRAAIKSAFKAKMRKIRYQTLANWLDVGIWEADKISTVIAKPFPAAARFGYTGNPSLTVKNGTRASRQSARHHEIKSIIGGLSCEAPPSSREMQGLLSNRGVRVSHVTICSDYKALGIKVN